jgi:cysteine desulfurase
VIYLDYNATTPVDPRALERMMPFFTDTFGNASSVDHGPGNAARLAVEAAREKVASLFRASADEVVFTGGATESNNIAIMGAMRRAAPEAEILVSAVEHPAVLEPATTFGDRVGVVPVDSRGVVDPADFARMLTPRTALVCLMAANNETGAVQPIQQVGAICREAGVAFHVDATQAAARMSLDVDRIHATSLAISGHKMYAPKGVGALYVRRRPRARIAPITFGGGQERGLRPGTLNVPGIVGLGEAAALVASDGKADWALERRLRENLLAAFVAADIGVVENSPSEVSLQQTLSVRFPGVTSQAVLRDLSSVIAVAAGSACATTNVEPSHVLLAQGLSEAEASESIRVSFGRGIVEDHIDTAARAIIESARRLVRLRAAA